jgi:predicted enzyme related to lactoylglutathione lyase
VNDVRLAAIAMPGEPEPWIDLGFAVTDGAVAVANGAIRSTGTDSWIELDGPDFEPASIEDIPVRPGRAMTPDRHPNGAVELDHVVIMTDSLDRTSAVVTETLGLSQRRLRQTASVRQAFHRFADVGDARGCIVEIVENPTVDRVAIWGVVVNVVDLDQAIAAAGGLISRPKDAVQPGRRIATVSRTAGLPIAVAIMSR